VNWTELRRLRRLRRLHCPQSRSKYPYPFQFKFHHITSHHKNCSFSFSISFQFLQSVQLKNNAKHMWWKNVCIHGVYSTQLPQEPAQLIRHLINIIKIVCRRLEVPNWIIEQSNAGSPFFPHFFRISSKKIYSCVLAVGSEEQTGWVWSWNVDQGADEALFMMIYAVH